MKSSIAKNGYFKLLLVLIPLQLLLLFVKVEGAKKNNCPPSKWALTAYNFGGLEKFTPEEQINLLNKKGYKGIILRGATEGNVQNLDAFIQESDEIKDFHIQAVFVRYNFTDSENDKNRWKKVVDIISEKNIQLWFIFGKKVEGITDDFIELKLREVVSYATNNKVEVILYPHSKCYIESAEEALPFVEKINHPNLNLAFHLYHEIRAGNGSRIDEVFESVKNKLGAVTMAGTDSVADFSKPKAMDNSTIKPLGEGNFDMNQFINPLRKSGYIGMVGFMNFKIDGDPEVYLKRSKTEWEKLIQYKTD